MIFLLNNITFPGTQYYKKENTTEKISRKIVD